MARLPIEEVLPALKAALRERGAAVLQAPPGAGKTTVVPLALLGEPWLAGRRVVMLEPRRLAARAAARRMAQTLGEPVGETVGHRVRGDTRVGPRTRIEVVTEGVLTRMLQSDPALEGVGAVLFDEFHERSLHADLGLALTLHARGLLREDLRVVVMSATLDGEGVSALLGGAPLVTSEGRVHPVETRWLPRRAEGWTDRVAAAAVLRALDEEPGDLLVFLPGAGEIRGTEARLAEAGLPPTVRVLPLHGTLPPEAQDRAIAPSAPGTRKVVLATSIAETSLTIEGVRVVVDAGLARAPRFSPRTGMTRLETARVSRASADQRRGRAGRTGPGVCLRLWTRDEDRQLAPRPLPEIAEADLAPLALELAAWGAEPAELAWLDPPPAAAFAQARELLRALGALDPDGALTPHGRRMAGMATHPRLAHMLLRAAREGWGATACDVAALLGERDVLRAPAGGPADADLRLRVELLRDGRRDARRLPSHVHGMTVDRDGVRRAAEEARQLRGALHLENAPAEPDLTGPVLALAYPDRLAQRRPGGAGRFLLRNGRGAAFAHPQALSESPWLVVAELDGAGAESRIYLAAPLAREDVDALFADQVETETTVAWEGETREVRARRRERLGALVLRESALADPDPAEVARALSEGIAREGLGVLPWTDGARRLRERLAFLHALDADAWPDVSDAALLAALPAWLGPHLHGVRGRAQLDAVDLSSALLAMLPWDARARLDDLAPTHWTVPSGSRIPVDYSDADAPVLAVRLQEMFGLADTPRVAGGRVPLTLHLLSPAHRPVQVTRDLAGFWKGSYFDVRKELRGRYPKHVWPEDPMAEPPTRRAKPRGT